MQIDVNTVNILRYHNSARHTHVPTPLYRRMIGRLELRIFDGDDNRQIQLRRVSSNILNPSFYAYVSLVDDDETDFDEIMTRLWNIENRRASWYNFISSTGNDYASTRMVSEEQASSSSLSSQPHPTPPLPTLLSEYQDTTSPSGLTGAQPTLLLAISDTLVDIELTLNDLFDEFLQNSSIPSQSLAATPVSVVQSPASLLPIPNQAAATTTEEELMSPPESPSLLSSPPPPPPPPQQPSLTTDEVLASSSSSSPSPPRPPLPPPQPSPIPPLPPQAQPLVSQIETLMTDATEGVRCKVCLVHVANTLVIPCMHIFCFTCAHRIHRCAMCRRRIVQRSKFFY